MNRRKGDGKKRKRENGYREMRKENERTKNKREKR